MGGFELAKGLGEMVSLDRIAAPVAKTVKKVVGHGFVKDLLSGTWLGHTLHPMLTDVPIGSFTSGSLLDLFGGERAQPAADALVTLGVVSALPTAAAGLADWSDTYGSEQRVGVVHAASNIVGVVLYASSLLARARGRRAMATSLGLLGMTSMTAGGYLGGYLGYARGVGVNNAFWQEPPTDWTPVIDDVAVPEGGMVRAAAGEANVLLCRLGGQVLAIGDRCTHAGGPLHEGRFEPADGPYVTCPWHRSVFDLRDGSVVHGPAAVPEPAYEVRTVNGKIEVRAQ